MSDQRLFPAALLDPDAPCPAGLTAWSGSDPARRFAVYRNNVVVSLIEVSAHQDFDLTAHLALLLRADALSSLSLPTEALP